MSQYSCLKIISTKAKKMARASSVLTHSQALEIIVRQSKFSNYHELTRVAKYAPLEPRLLMAAFEMAVDHELSGESASTNAGGFTVEDLIVTETHYDEDKGILNLKVSFLYQGDQLPDHVYSGSEFEVDANIGLLWRDEKWSFIDEDFEITNVVSDTEQAEYYDAEDI
ncbi:hypothetical protein JI672_003589 [Salmonella enterica]|nr:hypothetical protein [Salmonella enterica]EGY9192736.1 hypothetical protein [Salmonella enterica]